MATPLPLFGCSLDRVELEAQLARYRQLCAHVQEGARGERELRVRFDAAVDRELLADTLAAERRCCSFLRIDVDDRELTIGVQDAAQAPALEAIAGQLGLAHGGGRHDGLIELPGGRFLMGADDRDGFPADREGPVREVAVAPFRIDPFAVTVERFAAFVRATDHVTEAERHGWSFVFGGHLPADFPPTRGIAGAPWWRQVHGADWRHPEGPHSDVEGRARHPVVHVAHTDALAYCAWAGVRLPAEAEWEYAARGGLEQRRFPWGDELTPAGEHRCNIWQGSFPADDTAEDGYAGTAPVDAFAPNGFGLFNTSGNVWEWCADAWDPEGGARVIRGGSFLCHESYCNRYRVAARSSSTPDSSSANTGFRVAADAVAQPSR